MRSHPRSLTALMTLGVAVLASACTSSAAAGPAGSGAIVAVERSLFTQHKVKAFLYNQQVTDTLTESFVTLAHANGIPVVGVYETMPVPGYDYQSWMVTEVQDLQKAVAGGVSTEHL